MRTTPVRPARCGRTRTHTWWEHPQQEGLLALLNWRDQRRRQLSLHAIASVMGKTRSAIMNVMANDLQGMYFQRRGHNRSLGFSQSLAIAKDLYEAILQSHFR